MDFKLLPSKWLNKKNGLQVRREDRAETPRRTSYLLSAG